MWSLSVFMDANADSNWISLLSAQSGVVSHLQARRAGFTPSAIEHRLNTGKWQRMELGVYATFTGQPAREARLWAALLRAGPGAMLSYETAAELHGLVDKPSPHIHVTVPGRRRPAQRRPIRGVILHRSDASRPQLPVTWKLPRTRIEDTVLDLVAAAPTFDGAYTWISLALTRRLVTAGMLRDALAARSRFPRRAWVSDALDDAADGAHLRIEMRYARDVERAHRLPTAKRQAPRTIDGKTHYKDNWYEPYGICVELDGTTYHQDRVRQDRRRDNVNLAMDDARTFRFGLVDVTESACRTALLVAAALRRQGWQGTPRACRKPGCPAGEA